VERFQDVKRHKGKGEDVALITDDSGRFITGYIRKPNSEYLFFFGIRV
jgi:hypothetical protein